MASKSGDSGKPKPSWKVLEIQAATEDETEDAEEEDYSDEAFKKRHAKLETSEKRSKMWHNQWVRQQEYTLDMQASARRREERKNQKHDKFKYYPDKPVTSNVPVVQPLSNSNEEENREVEVVSKKAKIQKVPVIIHEEKIRSTRVAKKQSKIQKSDAILKKREIKNAVILQKEKNRKALLVLKKTKPGKAARKSPTKKNIPTTSTNNINNATESNTTPPAVPPALLYMGPSVQREQESAFSRIKNSILRFLHLY